MTKNDFEVWIFNQLLQHRFKDKTNYEISRDLKIPESKVKRLRYEADLKFSAPDQFEGNIYEIVSDCVAHSYIRSVENDVQIQFVVENQALRKFLEFKLKQGGFFLDTSFNSEIVSIRSEALRYLYELTPQGRAEFNLLEKDVNNKEVSSKSKEETNKWFVNFLKSMIKGAGETAGKFIVNLSLQTLLSVATS